jgi:hypothetical protein
MGCILRREFLAHRNCRNASGIESKYVLDFVRRPACSAFAPVAFSARHSSLQVVSEPTAAGPEARNLVTKEANIKPVRRTRPTLDPFNPDFERIEGVAYNEAFPQSTKEYTVVQHEDTGHILNIPFRRVHLEDPVDPILDLYDTSGHQGVNPKEGLPKIRQEWIEAREGKHDRYTQMHFAKKGMITEEMLYCALFQQTTLGVGTANYWTHVQGQDQRQYW